MVGIIILVLMLVVLELYTRLHKQPTHNRLQVRNERYSVPERW